MTYNELRKKLFALLGKAIIYTNEFHSINLMQNTSFVHHIILDIYSLLSNPRVSAFNEDKIEDDVFLMDKYKIIEKELEEHFSYSYMTAQSVNTFFDEKEWENKISVFTSLFSDPKPMPPILVADEDLLS